MNSASPPPREKKNSSISSAHKLLLPSALCKPATLLIQALTMFVHESETLEDLIDDVADC